MFALIIAKAPQLLCHNNRFQESFYEQCMERGSKKLKDAVKKYTAIPLRSEKVSVSCCFFSTKHLVEEALCELIKAGDAQKLMAYIKMHGLSVDSYICVDEDNLEFYHRDDESSTDKPLFPFNLSNYVPLTPSHEINTQGKSQQMEQINPLIFFANHPKFYDSHQAVILNRNVIQQYGELLLKSACAHNNSKLVKRVLASGINPFSNVEVEVPVLQCVALGGSIEIFDMLVSNGKHIRESTYLNYAIHETALLAENYALAVHIEKRFPYADYIGTLNYDLLGIAMAMRNLHAIIALPALHAVIPTQKHLDFAWKLGQIKTLELFFMKAAAADLTSVQLSLSIFYNHSKLVEILLKRNCDPNSLDKNGDSALSQAISLGQLQTVNLLLQYKANPNLPNSLQVTPMIRAAAQGSKKIMQALIDAKGNLQIDYHGKSLFEIAIVNQNLGLASYLISKGYFSPNQVSTTQKLSLRLFCNICLKSN